jgi:DNA polymerase III delta prime subunit
MKISFSWRFILRAISVLSWVYSAIRVYHQPDLVSLIGFILGTVSFIGSFFVSNKPIKILEISEEEKRARDRRNRAAMLKKVNEMWVEGVLKKSLHKAVLIELGLQERKDAVDTPDRPWDMVLQTADKPNRALPQCTKILDVFDGEGKALLILGEPGSGKTTMLLELARETISRAEKDQNQPIPVVFNFSSWREPSQTIADWLVDELNTKYYIPKKIANTWVENDQLLLLLDGFDEVAVERRDTCVKAINDFRKEHLMPIAICSRTEEYKALTTLLKMNSAVCIQPLTEEQIKNYFDKCGTELTAVRKMLKDDEPLRELSRLPLMLNIMTLAYTGASAEEIGQLDTTEARREHLFNKYIDVMFNRVARTKNELYPRDKTIKWLSWLAEKMTQDAQSVFLIERMQPTWLQTRVQKRQYMINTTLISCVVGGLLFGFVGLVLGSVGLGSISGLIAGMGMGLAVGLFILYIDRSNKTIKPIELLKWSWKEAKVGLIQGLILGPVFGLIGALIFRGPTWELMIVGSIVGMSVGPIVGMILIGLSYAEVKERTVPNQGIRLSIRNVAIALLATIIGSVLIAWLAASQIVVLGLNVGVGATNEDVYSGLLFVVFALLYPLTLVRYGGMSVIKHFSLRFTLYRKGYIPLNIMRFFDYAAERIFLQKVGGGYKFIHRLIQEHFASLM